MTETEGLMNQEVMVGLIIFLADGVKQVGAAKASGNGETMWIVAR